MSHRTIATHQAPLSARRAWWRLALFAFTIAVAGAEEVVPRADYEALLARIAALEARLGTLEQTPAAAPAGSLDEVAGEVRPTALLATIPDRLELGLLVEMEGTWASHRHRATGVPAQESDLTLATVELAMGLPLNDWLRADVVVLFEEDDTEPPTIDVATLTLGDPAQTPWSLSVGRQYLPFGSFETALISDPLTLELAETQGTAAVLAYQRETFGLAAGLFNGDAALADGDEDLRDFVLSGNFTITADWGTLGGGLGYTSNLANAASLGGEVSAPMAHSVPGVNAYLALTAGQFTLCGEHVTATRAVGAGELSFAPAAATPHPSASSVELAYAATELLTLATRYQVGHDLSDWLPEKALGLGASYCLWQHGETEALTLSLEYQQASYDDASDSREHRVTSQLALAF